MRIVHDNYGKSRVRLLKVERKGNFHSIQETTVNIALEGDFDEIHTVGDNSLCLPTDTMKNTVYALAHQTTEIEEIETFAKRLTEHFLTNNPQITRVIIEIIEHGWTRLGDSEPHPHSFIKGSNEQRMTKVNATRDAVAIESGVIDLIVLKTTKSGFVGYLRKGMTLQARFLLAERSLWQLLFDDVSDWLDQNSDPVIEVHFYDVAHLLRGVYRKRAVLDGK